MGGADASYRADLDSTTATNIDVHAGSASDVYIHTRTSADVYVHADPGVSDSDGCALRAGLDRRDQGDLGLPDRADARDLDGDPAL